MAFYRGERIRKLTVLVLTLVCFSTAPVDAKICPQIVQYVCGTKDGQQKTYTNSCFARADHAMHIIPGKCEDQSFSQMKFCPEIFLPVCATKDGVERTYGNSCFAIADGATILHKGKCGVTK
jgi:hypothetical protein